MTAGLLAACTPAEPPAAAPSDNPVLASRAALGEPMLELAESMLAVSDGIDAARHRLPRGAEMVRALKGLVAGVARLQRAVDDARAAAAEAPVEDAAAIVEDAATSAATAVRAAEQEIAFLRAAGTIDAALLEAAAEWDRPGSQSEIRERLDALADDIAALRPRVAKLRPVPRLCRVMKSNRAEWVATVHSRTVELQGQANSAGGSEYDRLRRSYRALPFAVEARTADRADRDCWLERSPVARAAPAMRAAVEELRASLSG